MSGDLTKVQKQIIFHASGLERSRKIYRDYYNTEENDANLLELVRLGYFTGPVGSAMFAKGCANFYLTDLGKAMSMVIKMEGGE